MIYAKPWKQIFRKIQFCHNPQNMFPHNDKLFYYQKWLNLIKNMNEIKNNNLVQINMLCSSNFNEVHNIYINVFLFQLSFKVATLQRCINRLKQWYRQSKKRAFGSLQCCDKPQCILSVVILKLISCDHRSKWYKFSVLWCQHLTIGHCIFHYLFSYFHETLF